MAEVKQYKGRYTGQQIDELLGRVPTIDHRVTQLEAGGGDKHIEFNFYNKSVWRCTHNLGKNPSVTVVDSNGDTIIADVRYIGSNYLEVYFGIDATGRVILN